MSPEKRQYAPIDPPERILMAPGPCNLHPAVQRAAAAPLMGHMDPVLFQIMDDTIELLRYAFQTENGLTFSFPGTGGAGMVGSFLNVVEPGDRVVIGVGGVFAGRMVDVAARLGADVKVVETPWGKAVDAEDMRQAVRAHQPKVVAVVHGETSTGVEQPLGDIAKIAHEAGALFLVDTVATLGGVDVPVDKLGIDVCYSGSQKCLGAPPGLSPVTFNDRAVEAIRQRKSKPLDWYLDASMLEKYWNKERVYHHTAPVLMIYALREALRIVYEEGLEARFARHSKCADGLVAGLQAMGLQLFADPAVRLVSVTSVVVPEGVDDARVRGGLLNEFGIEIAGGLAAYRGRMWRIGLMGYSAQPKNVLLLLTALETLLRRHGFKMQDGAGVAAAEKAFG